MSDQGARIDEDRRVASRALTGPGVVTITSSASRPGETVQVHRKTAAEYAALADSENTRRSYGSDLRRFRLWLARMDTLARHQIDEAYLANSQFDTAPVDPQTVADYIAYKAEEQDDEGQPRYAASTISKWVAAISWEHLQKNAAPPSKHPLVINALKGIRRTNIRPTRRAAPLLLDPLRTTLLAIDLTSPLHGAIGTRDAALLLFGWVGAFRASEVAALTIGDVTLHSEEGLRVRLQKAKTDQEGRGGIKVLPFGSNPVTCAPCAYVRWYRLLQAQGDTRNRPALFRALRENTVTVHLCRDPFTDDLPRRSPVFRALSRQGLIRDTGITPTTVGSVVHRRAHAAGVETRDISGHSLRAGFITEALNAGASKAEIMRQTLQRDERTIDVYDRENNPLVRNAVTRVRL